ncbi:MAG: hypothetical protein FJZ16_05325, partial [Candidatus Omnitrophica bacterium]|nr:hypothetical protein [Candidatus Omnitrophota bacterium]
MKKGRLLKNAGMSTVQIIIVTGSFIYMYKYLLGVIGIERLGIWSLVIASTSITQIANLGMAGGVVKFVAKYFARGELDNLNGIVQTALWSLAVASGLLMIVAYPLCAYGLSFV